MAETYNPISPPNGWGKYGEYVLNELKAHNEFVKATNECLGKLREDVAGLKVKAGVWGMIGGLIPVIIALGIWLVEKGIVR